MPYCFIWSGFVMRGTDKSRWTNGVIEKYIGTKKGKAKTHLRKLPANYVTYYATIVKGYYQFFYMFNFCNNVKNVYYCFVFQ
jgi:hypothetical protein